MVVTCCPGHDSVCSDRTGALNLLRLKAFISLLPNSGPGPAGQLLCRRVRGVRLVAEGDACSHLLYQLRKGKVVPQWGSEAAALTFGERHGSSGWSVDGDVAVAVSGQCPSPAVFLLQLACAPSGRSLAGFELP